MTKRKITPTDPVSRLGQKIGEALAKHDEIERILISRDNPPKNKAGVGERAQLFFSLAEGYQEQAACIQAASLDGALVQVILAYSRLQELMQSVPEGVPGLAEMDRSYIERCLFSILSVLARESDFDIEASPLVKFMMPMRLNPHLGLNELAEAAA